MITVKYYVEHRQLNHHDWPAPVLIFLFTHKAAITACMRWGDTRGHLPDGLLFINILYYGAEVAAEEEFRIMLTIAVQYSNRHRQSVSNSTIITKLYIITYLLFKDLKNRKHKGDEAMIKYCLHFNISSMVFVWRRGNQMCFWCL